MPNFGRTAEVVIGKKKFAMKDYNLEATIPFDADLLPNEAEIRIWNLSRETLAAFESNMKLTVNAGYEGDAGLVFSGMISSVQTAWDGVDQVTTIHALDSEDFSKRKKRDMAFAKGTYASSIIRQLASLAGLPVAMLELKKDYQYKNGYADSGILTDMIKKVADACATGVYINKGKLYVRDLYKGASSLFKLSKTTGLIGTPEPFQDENVKGYNLKQQLQYRVTTASIIDVDSSVYQGRLYVRGGTHRISRTGDFITESEGLLREEK